MIVVEIPGKPVAWKRAGRSGSRYYDSQLNEKNLVRWYYKIAHNGILSASEPLSVDIQYHISPPKSLSLQRALKLIGAFHSKKPDIDNLTKIIFDALNGVAWKDDSQIATLTAYKIYSEEEKTILTIKIL
jgi:Holliday junction resolvase RusA-like endonuclease